MTPQSECRRRCVSLAIAFAVLLGFAFTARVSAQMVGATISGTVVDPTGGVVPGV